jgi:hypothetical protein
MCYTRPILVQNFSESFDGGGGKENAVNGFHPEILILVPLDSVSEEESLIEVS